MWSLHFQREKLYKLSEQICMYSVNVNTMHTCTVNVHVVLLYKLNEKNYYTFMCNNCKFTAHVVLQLR